MKTTAALLIVGLLLVMGGYYFFWQGTKGLYNYIRSSRFVPTTATVTYSGTEDTHFIFKGDRFHRVYVVVRYRYSVNGETYEGTAVEPYKRMWPLLEGERFVERFPPGTRIRIIYNPEDPSDSFISRKFRVEMVILPLVFLVFLGVVGMLIWIFLP